MTPDSSASSITNSNDDAHSLNALQTCNPVLENNATQAASVEARIRESKLLPPTRRMDQSPALTLISSRKPRPRRESVHSALVLSPIQIAKKYPFLRPCCPPSFYPQWHSNESTGAFCESRHWSKEFALHFHVCGPATPGCYERRRISHIGSEWRAPAVTHAESQEERIHVLFFLRGQG